MVRRHRNPRPGEGTSEGEAFVPRPILCSCSVLLLSGPRLSGTLDQRVGLAETEQVSVRPHAVQHNPKASGDRNYGALHSATLRHPHAPSAQPGVLYTAIQHRGGRLIQCGPDPRIASPADAARHISFAGLITPRCQPEMRSDHFRRPEPPRIINTGFHGQRDKRSDTRHAHHQTAHIVDTRNITKPLVNPDQFSTQGGSTPQH